MRELRDILSQLASLRGRGEPAAVATVVRCAVPRTAGKAHVS